MLLRNCIRNFRNGDSIWIVSVVRDDDDWRIEMLESGAVQHPVTFALHGIDAQVDLIEAHGKIPSNKSGINLSKYNFPWWPFLSGWKTRRRRRRAGGIVADNFPSRAFLHKLSDNRRGRRQKTGSPNAAKRRSRFWFPDELIKLHWINLSRLKLFNDRLMVNPSRTN